MTIKLLTARKINGALRFPDEIIDLDPASEAVIITDGDAVHIPSFAAPYGLDEYGNPTMLVDQNFDEIPALPDRTYGNLGTRIPFGRVVNSAGFLGNTFHVMSRMATEFDAVRLILMNPTVADIVNVTAAVCPGGSTSDPLQSSATWTNVTFGGAASTTLTLSSDANSPTIKFSDWMAVTGDSSKLISARVYIPSASNTTCPVYSVGASIPWATQSGEEWIARYQTGDFVTTPASMNTASNQTNSAIIGIQYLARGKVCTVMGLGDSIMAGVGSGVTLICDSYWVKACRTLRNMNMPVEVCNLGWSGQTTTQIYTRATVAMPALTPDVVLYSAFSPNDGAPTASTDRNMRLNWLRARNLIDGMGIPLIAVTGIPRAATASSSNWTNTQDAFRKNFNNQVVKNLDYSADIAYLLSNSEDVNIASWFMPNLTDDFVHPNEAGNIVAAVPALTALRNFV